MEQLARRFGRYAVAGGAATAVDFGVLWLLVYVAGLERYPLYLFAATAAFLVATVVNYSINRRWAFADRSAQGGRVFLKFLVVAALGIGLNNLILGLLVQRAGWAILVAKLAATVVTTCTNFAANNLWSFRSKALPV
jgi:putative flippase GtrA